MFEKRSKDESSPQVLVVDVQTASISASVATAWTWAGSVTAGATVPTETMKTIAVSCLPSLLLNFKGEKIVSMQL